MSITAFKLYKKLINELKFRYSELDYVEQEIADNMQVFEEYYREFCSKNNISIGDLESKNQKKVDDLFGQKPIPKDTTEPVRIEVSEETLKKRKVFQRIYRSIAKKIHPDKFSNMKKTVEIAEKEETFKKATYAYENDKWGMLLEIAEELDIHPSKYTKINEILRDEISDINKKINDKQKTYSWLMSQAETDRQRDKIIISFLKNLFNFDYKEQTIYI